MHLYSFVYGKLKNKYKIDYIIFKYKYSLFQAIRLLHTVKVSEIHNINKARQLLNFFALNYEHLYGKQQLTYNLHNFVFHLCDDVQRHGSSSLHAMWSIESSLGELTRSVKGNRGVSNQILSSD